MKVLFVNSYDDPAISGGGAEVTLQHLTQGVLSRGVEPVILATTDQRGLKLHSENGVRVWRAGIRNCYWNLRKQRPHPLKRMLWHGVDSYNVAMRSFLSQVIEAEKPDVVSFHNLSGWSAAIWGTAAAFGIPTVQVLHDMYLICPKSTMHTKHGNCSSQCKACGVLRLPHRAASNTLSAVVGVSRFVLQRHLDQGYFQRVPIRRVIYNARDAAALGVGSGCGSVISKNIVRFGYIGRLDTSKGVELLLRAFNRAEIPDAELWIAGSGSDNYIKVLQDRWASERVRFLGRVSQAEFYPNVDIVVVPSLWQEPLGMVVAEAFAFGKPVVAACRGGIPEMVSHGENGLLFDPENLDDLVSALQRLSSDNALREGMGRNAIKSAEFFVNRKRWIDDYLGLYSEVSSDFMR